MTVLSVTVAVMAAGSLGERERETPEPPPAVAAPAEAPPPTEPEPADHRDLRNIGGRERQHLDPPFS